MKVTLDFPVMHDRCNTCEHRFACWTRKVHVELDLTYGDGSYHTMIQPFIFGLDCFRLEPWSRVRNIKLDILPDGTSMVLDLFAV